MKMLLSYLARPDVKRKYLAKAAETSQVNISRWARGKAVPNDEMKVKLEIVTEGHVPIRSWFPDTPFSSVGHVE